MPPTLRVKPYTRRGLAQVKCIRCGTKGCFSSWQVCADYGQYRPLCVKCDILLNELVMVWSNRPPEEIQQKMHDYRARIEAGAYDDDPI